MSTESTEEVSPASETAPAAPPPSASSSSQSPWMRALMRVLRQPAFVVVAGVLLVAALGLNAAVTTMKLHFKKEPVALKHELGTVPSRFGTWVQISQDQALDKEMQDVLGTDKYIFRDYVDEQVVGKGKPEEYQALRDQAAKAADAAAAPGLAPEEANRRQAESKRLDDEVQHFIPRIRRAHPNGVVSLSVTYYTGMVDTVAHVPDRCVTADGYEPKSYETPSWPIGANLPQSAKPNGKDDIEVRFINFEDQTGTSNVPRNIAYFFHSNGKFISSPLGVRQELANLFEKRGYYAKIECMTTIEEAKDSGQSSKVLTDFLTAALPDIYRCMPDWNQPAAGATAVAAK